MFICCHEDCLESHRAPPPVILLFLLVLAVLAFVGVNRMVNRFHQQEEALARHLYERGMKAQSEGQAEAAPGAFRAALSYSHDNFQYQLSLARALRVSGRTAEAETYLIRLWERTPRRVLAIPFKKTDHRLVPYLAQEEMQALLDAPDPSTRMGVRDRAMLQLAVCAGLRVSELTGLRTDDVAPQSASIRVRGKGRRERALPLWKTTAAALRAWLAIRGAVASPELFVNARGTPFSRWGVAYVLRRHTETADRKCLTLRGKQVSPHVLRHTCAMIVLQATKDIRKVSLWLGHSDLTTTEVYVRADPTEKLEAIEAVVPLSLRKGKFRPPDKLLALLKVKP